MHVLIVDDDETVILACRRHFTKHGATVEAVTTPQAALEALGRSAFDAVVSDYQLRADLSGVDVLEATARLQPRASRILMSGVADAAVIEEARTRARIHDFVEKPMTARALVEVVGRSVFHAPPPRTLPEPGLGDRDAERAPGREGMAFMPDLLPSLHRFG